MPGLPNQPAPKPKPKAKPKAKAKARGTAAGEEETKPPAKKKRKVFYRVPKGLFGGVAKDNNGRALCFDHNLGLATDHTFLNHPA